jgi:hypothetical protein
MPRAGSNRRRSKHVNFPWQLPGVRYNVRSTFDSEGSRGRLVPTVTSEATTFVWSCSLSIKERPSASSCAAVASRPVPSLLRDQPDGGGPK